jgi:hypothetical protein
MILQAVTANAFSAAAGVAAITEIHVFVFFTVHHNILSFELSGS